MYVGVGGLTVSLKIPCSPHDGTTVVRGRVDVAAVESAGTGVGFFIRASLGPGM